jgi:hypothetical protein
VITINQESESQYAEYRASMLKTEYIKHEISLSKPRNHTEKEKRED